MPERPIRIPPPPMPGKWELGRRVASQDHIAITVFCFLHDLESFHFFVQIGTCIASVVRHHEAFRSESADLRTVVTVIRLCRCLSQYRFCFGSPAHFSNRKSFTSPALLVQCSSPLIAAVEFTVDVLVLSSIVFASMAFVRVVKRLL